MNRQTSSRGRTRPEFSQGANFCFAALHGADLAAYAWFALGSIEASNNRGRTERSGVALSFPNDVAFLYKGMTLPDYRGLGLYGHVNAMGLQALDAHGVRSILSTMDWTNHAAQASCDKLGYETLGRVWRWGWGDYLYTAAPAKATARGVLFDRNAVVSPRPATLPGSVNAVATSPANAGGPRRRTRVECVSRRAGLRRRAVFAQ